MATKKQKKLAILRSARKYIERGWTQGEFAVVPDPWSDNEGETSAEDMHLGDALDDQNLKVCLLGGLALGVAEADPEWFLDPEAPHRDTFDNASNHPLVAELVDGPFTQCLPAEYISEHTGKLLIPNWNDAPVRTQDEVLHAVDCAIEHVQSAPEEEPATEVVSA